MRRYRSRRNRNRRAAARDIARSDGVVHRLAAPVHRHRIARPYVPGQRDHHRGSVRRLRRIDAAAGVLGDRGDRRGVRHVGDADGAGLTGRQNAAGTAVPAIIQGHRQRARRRRAVRRRIVGAAGVAQLTDQGFHRLRARIRVERYHQVRAAAAGERPDRHTAIRDIGSRDADLPGCRPLVVDRQRVAGLIRRERNRQRSTIEVCRIDIAHHRATDDGDRRTVLGEADATGRSCEHGRIVHCGHAYLYRPHRTCLGSVACHDVHGPGRRRRRIARIAVLDALQDGLVSGRRRRARDREHARGRRVGDGQAACSSRCCRVQRQRLRPVAVGARRKRRGQRHEIRGIDVGQRARGRDQDRRLLRERGGAVVAGDAAIEIEVRRIVHRRDDHVDGQRAGFLIAVRRFRGGRGCRQREAAVRVVPRMERERREVPRGDRRDGIARRGGEGVRAIGKRRADRQVADRDAEGFRSILVRAQRGN